MQENDHRARTRGHTSRVSPSLGVIIPMRDAERVIDQALASLAAQQVPVDQIMVVDDGSTDASVVRAERWRQLLPLEIIESKGGPHGIGAARKTGIGALDTDVVMQLDAGDFVLPEHTKVMLDTYRAYPGLVSPRQFFWNERYGMRPQDPEEVRRPRRDADLVSQLLIQNYVSVGSCYSKELYTSVGGYRSIRYGPDWDLWVRMIAAQAPFGRAETATYVYRVSAASYSRHVNRDETDLEVLLHFLCETTSAPHRRAAKIAVLQREGSAYLKRVADPPRGSFEEIVAALDTAGCPTTDVLQAAHDPDLGDIVRTAGDTTCEEHVTVLSVPDWDVVLAGRMTDGGMRVDYQRDEALRRLPTDDYWLGVMRRG